MFSQNTFFHSISNIFSIGRQTVNDFFSRNNCCYQMNWFDLI